MKTSRLFIVCVYKRFIPAFVALCVLTISVFAIETTEMPKEIQTQIKEPRGRTISLKLPLLQPDFHWTFMSRDDFLSGKLLLRIIREKRSSEIVIFENGQFKEGWEAMPFPRSEKRGEIYFGFISTVKYLTAPGDKLELELNIKKDLPGIGAKQAGILPAGTYISKGAYSGLLDDFDTSSLEAKLAEQDKNSVNEELLNNLRSNFDNKAFLESWEDQWPLKITSEAGWMSEEQVKAAETMAQNMWSDLNKKAGELFGQGQYSEAAKLSEEALKIAEKNFGDNHSIVAGSLNRLAMVYSEQGKYVEAEPLYKRSLAIWEKALGPDHPNVANTLTGLAMVYSEQGKYVEAEPLYKRSLAIQEKALGPDHPDMTGTLTNLAAHYSEQGKYVEAEPLYKRSLAIWEKALGPDHIRVAMFLTNLAELYCTQGKYAEAEPLYRRSLAIREKVFGPDHPSVATSLNFLAELLKKTNREAEAARMEARAKAIMSKAR